MNDDKQRLDWLEKNHVSITYTARKFGRVRTLPSDAREDIRAAIDAAMKQNARENEPSKGNPLDAASPGYGPQND
jgi:hypothetical protein